MLFELRCYQLLHLTRWFSTPGAGAVVLIVGGAG